jgi:ornithine cyclodeaminase
MRVVSAAEIDAALSFPALVEALDAAFRGEAVTPVRAHHTITRPGAPDATLLLMPAWTGPGPGAAIGTKIVTVVPDNAARGEPTVTGVYLLFAGDTGAPLAAMDGPRLTLWRTAAASALAARHLARADASRLVMVGAGALAPFLVRAHAAVRPIERVALWNRSKPAAERLAAALAGEPFAVTVTADLEAAVQEADIVSCATLAGEPLVQGDWLKTGAHVDLVGGFRPTMREADDRAVTRARLFCDTRAGALAEAGDLADPIARGVIAASDVIADLHELCRGAPGRSNPDEITLFKSVGTALEDLAAARLVWSRLAG